MEADISIWQKPGHFYFALTLFFRSKSARQPTGQIHRNSCPVLNIFTSRLVERRPRG
jgi:hypothetical protein